VRLWVPYSWVRGPHGWAHRAATGAERSVVVMFRCSDGAFDRRAVSLVGLRGGSAFGGIRRHPQESARGLSKRETKNASARTDGQRHSFTVTSALQLAAYWTYGLAL
jgi:hypothetical protein